MSEESSVEDDVNEEHDFAHDRETDSAQREANNSGSGRRNSDEPNRPQLYQMYQLRYGNRYCQPLYVDIRPCFYNNPEFVHALLGNIHFEDVYIAFPPNFTMADSLMTPTHDNIRKFLTAVASLPKLDELAFHGFEDEEIPPPLSIINYCLSIASNRLQKFTCYELLLSGSHGELDTFGNLLRTCMCLESIDFDDCTFFGEESETSFVTTVLQSAACLPKLEYLGISTKDEQPLATLDQHTLNKLLTNPTIKSLKLGMCMLDEIANGLRLRANNASLQELELELTVSSCEAFTVKVAEAFAAALKANVIGGTIQLHINLEEDAASMQPIFDFLTLTVPALRVNTSTRNLWIDSYWEKPTTRRWIGSRTKNLWKQFADMMEVNTSIRSVRLRDVLGYCGDKEVNFYASLNSLGRGKLLGPRQGNATANRSEWIEMLATNKDHVANLFYYLSLNPSLCDVATPVALSRKRKRSMQC